MCKMKSLNNTPTQVGVLKRRQAPDYRDAICYDRMRLFVKSLGTACVSERSTERDCCAQLAVSAAEIKQLNVKQKIGDLR